MDKEEYFKIGTERKLPLRCPILNYCVRRAYTIYFFSDYSKHDPDNDVVRALQKDGYLPDDFEQKKVQLQGEVPIWSKGNGLGYYYNMCPEVNLFDGEHSLPMASGTASTAGDWDKERTGKSFVNGKCQHFSECSEFNKYSFDNKPTRIKKTTTNRRAPISATLRFEIFQRDSFTCQYCGATREDGAKLELDHKIPYSAGGKDEFGNLITSCKTCNLGKSNKII
jgi:5-methylcytosine-specific restriction endonuclease McrA